MSRHIWRGELIEYRPGVTQAERCAKHRADCTVVGDEACFPVREAMAFMEQAVRGIYDMDRLVKYEKAVARMKARKGRK